MENEAQDAVAAMKASREVLRTIRSSRKICHSNPRAATPRVCDKVAGGGGLLNFHSSFMNGGLNGGGGRGWLISN